MFFLPTSTVMIFAWALVLGGAFLLAWFGRRRWKELRHERRMMNQELAQAKARTEQLEEQLRNESLALEPDFRIRRRHGQTGQRGA